MTVDETSKSERKREATRLQNLGRDLACLNAAQLAEVPVSDVLAKALADYQRFSTNEAKRRQLQFIGKLMRNSDTAALQAALDLIKGRSARARFDFRQIEAWRDRLIEDPGALTEYLAEHLDTDRQALRHHIQRVQKSHDSAGQRTAARNLFRFLRERAATQTQADTQPD